MFNNKGTPSGVDEETWHKFVREVEDVVQKYYPEQYTTTNQRNHIEQTLEIIAMYMGGVIEQAMNTPIPKESLVDMFTHMYDHVANAAEEGTLH